MFNQDTLRATIVALEFRERQLANDPKMEQALAHTQRALLEVKSLERGDTMASLWTTDDVFGLCENWEGETTIKITDDEARRVLSYAEHQHDAEIGINWDVLRSCLDDVLSERDQDPNGGDGNDD